MSQNFLLIHRGLSAEKRNERWRIGCLSALVRPVGAMAIYNEFYGFAEQPFNITPDPRFLFYSQRHREALNHMLFGVEERKGFIQVHRRGGGRQDDTVPRVSPGSW